MPESYAEIAESIRDDLLAFAAQAKAKPNDPDLWDLQRSILQRSTHLHAQIKRDLTEASSHVYDLEEQQQALYGVDDAVTEVCNAFRIKKPRKSRTKR